MLNPENINEIIRERRSVFVDQFSDEKVNNDIVHQILENANWAPTHKYTEPWRFIVYTGEGLKQLGSLQAEHYKQVTTKDGTFKEERYKNLLTKPLKSSHIIVVGMRRDPKRSVPEAEELGAVFCAIQNMHLTATAYGVGAYLSTGGITYFHQAQKLFGWDDDDKLIGFFHLGMPKAALAVGKRKSIEDKVVWVQD